MKEEFRKEVIKRFSNMPKEIIFNIGNFGSFSKQEIIKHILLEDEIGKTFLEMELNFDNYLLNNVQTN